MPNYTRPNYTTQSAAVYKSNIDAMAAAFERIAAAFLPHAQNAGSPSPDLTIVVDAGPVFNGSDLDEKPAQTVTGFTIPASGTRIDRVVLNPMTGDAIRIAGTAVAGSPSATPPAIPKGLVPICRVAIASTDTAITNDMITDERVPSTPGLVMGTAVTASGSSVEFSVPPGVNRITVGISALSTAGTGVPTVQIGDAGGLETSGYTGSVNNFNGGGVATLSGGFSLTSSGAAAQVIQGALQLVLIDPANNIWVASGQFGRSDTSGFYTVAGSKTLTQTLDRIALILGGDTFDAGTINVLFEQGGS